MPERSSIKSLFNIKARFMFVIKVVGVMGEWYNLVIKTKNYHIALSGGVFACVFDDNWVRDQLNFLA